MSASHGPSAAVVVRSGTAPVYSYMRHALVALRQSPDDVASLFSLRFTYGSETVPVSFYELSFRDNTSWYFYWHTGRQEPLSYEEVLAIVNLGRLPAHERQFLDEQGVRDAWPEARTRKYQDKNAVRGKTDMRSSELMGHAIYLAARPFLDSEEAEPREWAQLSGTEQERYVAMANAALEHLFEHGRIASYVNHDQLTDWRREYSAYIQESRKP